MFGGVFSGRIFPPVEFWRSHFAILCWHWCLFGRSENVRSLRGRQHVYAQGSRKLWFHVWGGRHTGGRGIGRWEWRKGRSHRSWWPFTIAVKNTVMGCERSVLQAINVSIVWAGRYVTGRKPVGMPNLWRELRHKAWILRWPRGRIVLCLRNWSQLFIGPGPFNDPWRPRSDCRCHTIGCGDRSTFTDTSDITRSAFGILHVVVVVVDARRNTSMGIMRVSSCIGIQKDVRSRNMQWGTGSFSLLQVDWRRNTHWGMSGRMKCAISRVCCCHRDFWPSLPLDGIISDWWRRWRSLLKRISDLNLKFIIVQRNSEIRTTKWTYHWYRLTNERSTLVTVSME